MNLCLIYVAISCVLFGIVVEAKKSLHTTDQENNGKHMCNKTVIYSVLSREEYNYTYTAPSTKWCWKPPFRCTHYKIKSRTENKEVILYKRKTIHVCCSGYKNIKGHCRPICSFGCVHGQCVGPNNCSCSSGWEGSSCNVECQDGHYGKYCTNYCSCSNGATCDKTSGTCYCPAGYTGTYCETECPNNSFGKNCENDCRCKNGARCNPNNGTCVCLPGYIGKHCKDKCLEGLFGRDCKNLCKCFGEGTESCNHVDGSCQCKSGWTGYSCNIPCEENTWGPLCKNSCDCGINGTCNTVTGACLCPPGWLGDKCEEKCPVGFFEKDCKMKCPDCTHEPGRCHHETGWCNCPEGSTGPKCDLECPKGKYGKNCMLDCLCINGTGTCDPLTGSCICFPGWMGQECEFSCPEGRYGQNCNFSCECPNQWFCDSVNGSCNCDITSKNSNCIKDSLLFEYEQTGVTFVILAVVLCITFLIIVGIFIFFIRRKMKLASLLVNKKKNDASANAPPEETPSFSPPKFMNPAYEVFSSFVKENQRTIAQVPPFQTLKNEECDQSIIEDVDFKIPEDDAELDKNKDGNSTVEVQFEIADKNKQNRTSVWLPKVTFSKSEENTESETDVYGSIKNSIYSDVRISEEHHYENPQ